jgi:hypothetical protein
MDNYPIPDHYKKTVVIPVRINKGKLEWFYGGEMPELEDNVIADLIVPYYAVKDKKMLKKLSAEKIVDILPEKTLLMVEVVVKKYSDQDSEIKRHLSKETDKEIYKEIPSGQLRYIELKLLAPLQMILRGTKKSCLKECEVEIPLLKTKAESLHHAYSLLSEKIEIHRRTHGGNVFRKIFFKKDDSWFPLDYIRNQFEAFEEKERYIKHAEQLHSPGRQVHPRF